MYFRIDGKTAVKNMLLNNKIFVIDARDKGEYISGHIKGSVWMPYYEVKTKGAVLLPKRKDTVIYVYCATGTRSDMVCSILDGMGYTKVYNIGGFSDLI